MEQRSSSPVSTPAVRADKGNKALAAAGLIAGGFGIAGFCLAVYWFVKGYHDPNFVGLSLLGGYMSGVIGTLFSLSAAFFVFATYRSQREQIRLQEDELKKQELRYQEQMQENRNASEDADRRHRELLQAQIDENRQAEKRHNDLLQAQIEENKQAEIRHKEQLKRQQAEFEAREKQAQEQLEVQKEESKNQLAVFRKQDFDSKLNNYISIFKDFYGRDNTVYNSKNGKEIFKSLYEIVKIHNHNKMVFINHVDEYNSLKNYFNSIKIMIEFINNENNLYKKEAINLLRFIFIEEELLSFAYYFINDKYVQSLLRESGLLDHIPADRFVNPADKPGNAGVA